ncbi:MAG: F0F1 ATP synthase subunit gamma [Syntrophales bacterium]|nr:F0F1 ATP synthase subunit gamma [Syntrophales bacterium]HOG06977.1 F0F1 ATP synthase subunit gamma [Syntrophales bacterium]HOS77322.1 F0F1 ATP synthase subunit gamma [Syntrophales bacterium]HPB71062.1 F0F1 ATP synthase subunit gamma [Syntrophales bacterium]HQN26371.1 F0F1 ATP synthase subunit gamma [Syntrophales bacterium]
MQTTEALKRTIKSAGDLLSVVKTMKALAAVSIRQYQKAVESLADYNRTVEMGLQILLKSQPDLTLLSRPQPVRRLGVIVFGSDQGLCGQLNEQIATHALSEMDALKVPRSERTILSAGMRVTDYIEDAGQRVEETLTTPGSTSGITPMVQEIIMILESWRFEKHIDHFVLYYNKYLSGASYRPITVPLLPVDPTWLRDIAKKKWPSRSLPIFTLDPDVLLSTLVREYLFVSLYRAFAESLASENASRLASMQNAEKNIEERLQELHVHYHRQRQMTITEELLDIVAGFEALQEQARLKARSAHAERRVSS